MKKIVKLTESDLVRLINKVIRENKSGVRKGVDDGDRVTPVRRTK